MAKGKSLLRIIIFLVVIILQLIMTQVITFLATLFIPFSEDFPQTHSVFFAILLGLTFSVGVFWPGWLAIRRRWLPLPAKYPARFLGALLGAYLPLIAALFIYETLEAGNPFFLFSIMGSILGFYMMGYEEKKSS
jgi:hypothetical protein